MKRIKIPVKLQETFTKPARYRVAYGGRGSGKSWSVAQMLVARAHSDKCTIMCTRELQKSIATSNLKLVSETITRLGLDDAFDVGRSYIRHKTNGSEFLFLGLRHNADAIKSTEGIDILWIEEGHKTSEESFNLAKNTVRAPGSEIWVTFNPEDEDDYVYQLFVADADKLPSNSIVTKINYDDNPWFTDVLEQERLDDLRKDPDAYSHMWEGNIKKSLESSFYGKFLAELKEQHKITNLPYNPSFRVKTYWDIGMSDYTSIWFVQQIGAQFCIIDFFQDNGEDIAYYAKHINSLPYNYDTHYMPHDAGYLRQGMGGKTIRDQFEDVVKQGEVHCTKRIDSVMNGVNHVRNILPRCAFDKDKCSEGLKMLKNYRKKWNEDRATFEDKPIHDWASHAADAFREFATDNIDVNDFAKAYNYDALTQYDKVATIDYGVGMDDYI